MLFRSNKLLKISAEPAKTISLSQRLRYLALRYIAIAYHQIAKEKSQALVTSVKAVFSDSTNANELSTNIRADVRFEQLINGSSAKYREARHQIADKYYGK